MTTTSSARMERAHRRGAVATRCIWPIAKTMAAVLAFALLVGAAAPAGAQIVKQVSKPGGAGTVADPGAAWSAAWKLIGTGYSGSSEQGYSVAISADGNTALVGGPFDTSNLGAAWVFTRSAGTWSQQQKLVGTGYSGTPVQGVSVAISADGNTALVGGPGDTSNLGAAWVFTRSGGTWSQQQKLVGNGYSGAPKQGHSVALSADGNTAIVGGPFDTSDLGAAWVFTRSGGTWSQQQKLVGNGYSGAPQQGYSVALSADGNTAMIGGPGDTSDLGAAWVFTRSGGTWTEQGAKLVGTGNSGTSAQGDSVALSADGNTAMVGGSADNSNVGAAWAFTRSGGTWSQQGAKLVGDGYSGTPEQGYSVALSAEGNTAMIGGWADNGQTGAAWLFTRSGGAWTQQGAKLVGFGAVGAAQQGVSVALSAYGDTALVGGNADNSFVGAAWIYSAPNAAVAAHDFDRDGTSDLLWRNAASGELAMWLMSGGQLASAANIAQVPGVWSVIGSRDFNGDGYADILWRDTSGDLAIWEMSGPTQSAGLSLGNIATAWSVAGTGDFNADGMGDILWRNTSTGDVAIWLMSNGAFSSGVDLGVVPLAWSVAGTGDFNGDGATDILWRNISTGDLAIWFIVNGKLSSSADLGIVPLAWSVAGTGDFNGDGTSDVLWLDSSGDSAIWLIRNGQLTSGATIGQVPTAWSVAETGDFNGDGKSDIVWTDAGGDLTLWLMNGLSVSSAIGLGNVGTSWMVQGQNAD